TAWSGAFCHFCSGSLGSRCTCTFVLCCSFFLFHVLLSLHLSLHFLLFFQLFLLFFESFSFLVSGLFLCLGHLAVIHITGLHGFLSSGLGLSTGSSLGLGLS